MKIDYPAYFRLFFLILLSGFFIFGVTRLGTTTYETVFATEESFAENTSIGPVSVEGLSREEAQAKLATEVSNWQNNSHLFLSYSDQKIEVPFGVINLLLEESSIAAESGLNNPLLAYIDEKEISFLLSQLTSEAIMAEIKIEDVKKAIETQAGLLGAEDTTIRLVDFFSLESDLAESVIGQARIQAGFISELAEPVTIPISPYAKFSFLNEFARQYPEWTEDMLTLAASALYEASLQTNVQVIERQISQVRPQGIKTGFEAKVKRGKIDFVLTNPNDFPLQLTFQSLENGELSVSITGYPLVKRYEVRLSEEKSHPFRKVVQYSPFVAVGSETVKQAGMNGSSITVYCDVYAASGERLETVEISDDFYLPVHQIVVRSIMAEIEEEEIVEQEPEVETDGLEELAEDEADQDRAATGEQVEETTPETEMKE